MLRSEFTFLFSLRGKNMKKYEAPLYERAEMETQDVITASSGIVDNGTSSYEYNGETITGNKGTFSGLFSDIW